ncbi:SGNH/GDSL hydrolase family protein [Mesoplasma photuris]|uniref:SGNH/GDSL hydrolase family protein n=1 Tax=Mesoplasma photuris TaxID=217731 RepID=UPI0004E22A4B|nr:SGNH/GDSL hydrolase family protein [Mesoplasma photuris]
MKILLSLLGVVALGTTTAVTVVAAMPNRFTADADKMVGMGIDKSNAVEQEDLVNDLGFTNFYTIGDSLSDRGGLSSLVGGALTTAVKELSGFVGDNVETIKPILVNIISEILGGEPINQVLAQIAAQTILGYLNDVDTEKTKVEFKLDFTDGKGNIENSFTNGKPAAVLLAERLGFAVEDSTGETKEGQRTFNSAVNTNVGNLINVKTEEVGNNYAIGGATAANIHGIMGLVLNPVRIHDQARALIKDHKTKPTDLVFLEIGGNDLFSMMSLYESGKEDQIEEAMNEAIKNIKTALLILLNNGVSNIIVGNAPDISMIPSYFEDPKAHELSQEFNRRFVEMFDEVNENYGGTMRTYDMENNFREIRDQFIQLHGEDKVNVSDASVSLGGGDSTLDMIQFLTTEEGIEIKINVGNPRKDNLEKGKEYLFWDTIHPSAWVHEQVSLELIDIATEMSESINK